MSRKVGSVTWIVPCCQVVCLITGFAPGPAGTTVCFAGQCDGVISGSGAAARQGLTSTPPHGLPPPALPVFPAEFRPENAHRPSCALP